VAIVGRSSSGKNTLAKCMAGLRRQIGFVLQDQYVFADSIARNIAFGEDEPDMARVLGAAEVASAHEFIARLPFGYDTKIGETSLALSGGQHQRALHGHGTTVRPDRGPHRLRHRAPPDYRPQRRPDSRARARPPRGAGQSRRPDEAGSSRRPWRW